jgi:sugar phosphate isomerase/epimerase
MNNQPFRIGLSTCWNSDRHTDGYAMLREIADLGFQFVELSHGIRISLLSGILKALEEGWIRCRSVHNFCPLPMGIVVAAPNLYQPSARVSWERSRWFNQTIKTLEFANKIEAHRAVLHLGSLNFWFMNPAVSFERWVKEHPEILVTGEVYQEKLRSVLDKLHIEAKPAMGRVIACIESILPFAERYGVDLGFENREAISELPLEASFPSIFNHFNKASNVGFWYDCGHAKLKEQMGIASAIDILAQNAHRLIGVHLHDVVGKFDHQQIGTGGVDFKSIRPFLKPECALTLELSPHLSVDQILASKAYMEALLGFH